MEEEVRPLGIQKRRREEGKAAVASPAKAERERVCLRLLAPSRNLVQRIVPSKFSANPAALSSLQRVTPPCGRCSRPFATLQRRRGRCSRPSPSRRTNKRAIAF